jgi:hypothetical protein
MSFTKFHKFLNLKSILPWLNDRIFTAIHVNTRKGVEHEYYHFIDSDITSKWLPKIDMQSRDDDANHPSRLPCRPTSGHQRTLLYGPDGTKRPSIAYKRRQEKMKDAEHRTASQVPHVSGTDARICHRIRMCPITISHAVGSQNWGVNGVREGEEGHNIGRRSVSFTTSNQFFLRVGLLQNLTPWGSIPSLGLTVILTKIWAVFKTVRIRIIVFCVITLSWNVENRYKGFRNVHN